VTKSKTTCKRGCPKPGTTKPSADTEKNIQTKIMLRASKLGITLWRNARGHGVVGRVVARAKHAKAAAAILQALTDPHAVYTIVQSPREVTFGLCDGAADLIGIDNTTGSFVAIEVKRPRKRPTEAQANFIEHIAQNKGKACVAHSAEEMEQLLVKRNCKTCRYIAVYGSESPCYECNANIVNRFALWEPKDK